MFQVSGIIVDKSGRDYSGNMANAHGLKTERKIIIESRSMSRIPLKVTRRRKSLKKVLGTAHSHEFLTMIWAANALVQQRTGAGLKYLQVPPGIVNEIVQDRGSIFVWHLESMLNEGLVHSHHKPYSGRRLNCDNWAGFTKAYNAFYHLSEEESTIDLIDDNIVPAIPRIMWNQYQWHAGFSNEQYLYRYWNLYNSAEADAVIREKSGISLEMFCFAGFAAFSQSLREPWIKLNPLPQFGLDAEDMEAFLNVVSRPVDFMRNHAQKIRNSMTGKYYTPIEFRKSALRDYPIISHKSPDGTNYCAPFPELILARIAEGLFYDLKGDGRLGNVYGRRFERYVSDLINFRLSPALSIELEYKYRKGWKSPDVLVADDKRRLKLVVECKTLNLGTPVRQSPDPWQTHRSYFDSIVSGVVQIWRYSEFVHSSGQDKYNSDLSLARGVLITLHPWFIVDIEKRDEVIAAAEAKADEAGISASARIPVGFMHADDLERIVSLLDSCEFLRAVDEICLPQYYEYTTRNTWRSLGSQDREFSGVKQFPFGRKLGEVMPWYKRMP